MTEPAREEQIQNMIVRNKVLDRVFEQLTPRIRGHVTALGLRPRQQEDPAEQQQPVGRTRRSPPGTGNQMKDVSKMRVAEIDALIAQATMTEEQLAEYWQEQKVAAAFCRKPPEFKPNEQSGNLLDAYVKGMGWAVTIENVERAYENLKAEGAL